MIVYRKLIILYILRGSEIMTPLVATKTTNSNYANHGYEEQDALNALYQELEKGIQGMKNGEVFTIDEAWEEIDQI